MRLFLRTKESFLALFCEFHELIQRPCTHREAVFECLRHERVHAPDSVGVLLDEGRQPPQLLAYVLEREVALVALVQFADLAVRVQRVVELVDERP